MKIRVRDHAKLGPDKMTKIALAITPRSQLDLYCLAPGQAQKAHTHDEQDKICFVLDGRGTFTLDDREERLEPGEAIVAPAGSRHGIVNDGPGELLVLVVVTPPSPHVT
jgi:quercetin dioxygenase-like cupin family protein